MPSDHDQRLTIDADDIDTDDEMLLVRHPAKANPISNNARHSLKPQSFHSSPRHPRMPKSPPCIRAYLVGIYGQDMIDRVPPIFIGGVWGRTASLGEPYERTLAKAEARGVKVDWPKKRRNSKEGDGKTHKKVVFLAP